MADVVVMPDNEQNANVCVPQNQSLESVICSFTFKLGTLECVFPLMTIDLHCVLQTTFDNFQFQ